MYNLFELELPAEAKWKIWEHIGIIVGTKGIILYI